VTSIVLYRWFKVNQSLRSDRPTTRFCQKSVRRRRWQIFNWCRL